MNLSSHQLNSAAVPIMATRGLLPKPIPIDSHVKMFNFTAEMNIFTAFYRNIWTSKA